MIFFSSASAQQRQPSLSSVKSYLCLFYIVDNIVNTTDQCIYSPVRLIKLNQSELEFGAKRRRKKKYGACSAFRQNMPRITM